MVYFLPLIAGFLIAFSELYSKVIAGNKVSAEMKSLLANILGVLCALAFAFFEKRTVSISFLPLFLLILNGGLMAAGYILFFLSYKHVPLSLGTLLTKSQVLVYTLGGIILFNEHLSTKHIIGAVFIIISLLALNLTHNIRTFRMNKWTLGLLVTGVLFGVSILIDTYLSAFYSPFTYLALLFAVTSIIIVIYLLSRKNFSTSGIEITLVKNQSAAILFSVIGQALLLTTYQLGGYVSLSNLIALVRIPLVVLFGIVILKEKEDAKRKVLAMGILLIGLILLKL